MPIPRPAAAPRFAPRRYAARFTAIVALIAVVAVPAPRGAVTESAHGWAADVTTWSANHALAAPSSATGPGGAALPAPDQAYEGTLERFVAETVKAGISAEQFLLQTSTGTIELRFAAGAPVDFETGATVRVRGVRDGNVLHVDGASAALDGQPSGEVLVAAPGAGTGARRLAVVPLNFTNDRSRPFSRASAAGIFFTNTRSARSYFGEQSKGLVTIDGTTFDWVELPVSNSVCDHRGWAVAAKQVLTERGVDVSSFTNFAFTFPQTNSCSWRGLAHLPGPHTWINGAPTLRTAVHELGHNFGAHHASSIRCRSGGERVALSANCTTKEYGDPFTTMGAADRRHDHSLHLAQLGYLSPGAARTVTASGKYTLHHASSSTGTRVLRIPRGDGTWLYLEYRRPYGTLFDNFSRKAAVVRGVSIRIGGDWQAIVQTKLIDTRPGTSSFLDAALRLDRSFRDYRSGIRVTLVDRGRSRAWVRITFPADRIAPTAPGAFSLQDRSATALALGWSAATDNRAVAGYRIWRNGTLVKTTSASATTYSDTGLQPETSYTYTIRAVDTSGNVGPSATLTATTKPIDRPPTAPVASIEAQNGQWANLTWTASSDDRGVTGYRVFRDGAVFMTTASNVLEARVPRDGAAYSVVAVDTAGQASDPSNEVRS
jgi:hypothetical protein